MFKKIIASLLLTGILITNLGSITFANGINSEDSSIGTMSVGTPAYYEFKTTTRNFTKTKFDTLHAKAYKAASGGGTSAFVDLGLYIIGELGYSYTGTAYTAIGHMIKSDLNAVETMNYAYKYRKSITDNGYSSITTQIKYKRFWTGHSYLPWYAYGSPVYVKSNR